jgi:hypothetical protein
MCKSKTSLLIAVAPSVMFRANQSALAEVEKSVSVKIYAANLLIKLNGIFSPVVIAFLIKIKFINKLL